jgi:plasmid stability protein
MPSMITMKSIFHYLSINMASITIRNLDDAIKSQLRIAAATHGCSMEEEARQILRRALLTQNKLTHLGTRISQSFAKLGGIELAEATRSTPRTPAGFSEPEE